MSWSSLVFVLVPLLQLNVLAAEAFVGNSWNSRNLNLLRRPLHPDPQPNAVTQPIHAIPRPLPKPIEVRKIEERRPMPRVVSSESLVTERAREELVIQPYTHARSGQFNLQRRPLLPKPVIVAPPPAPIAPRVTAAPEPEIAPEPVPSIALEEEIVPDHVDPVPPQTTAAPTILLEEPSSEDIEIVKAPVRQPSLRSPPLRRYLMPRPIPRPAHVEKAPEPIITPIAQPIEEETIIKIEPEPIPEIPVVSSTPKVEATIPVISTTVLPEPVPTSTMPAVFIPKLIPLEADDEPINIPDEGVITPVEPEVVEPKIMEPVEVPTTLKPVTLPLPSTVIIEEYSVKPIPSLPPTRSGIRRRRPVTRIPGPKPTVTLAPSREIIKPVLPTSQKPIPLTPTKPPTLGRSIPTQRPIDEPTVLMDYQCDQVNAYYGISNECDSYVECKSSLALMSTCPDGLHFNSRAVWPEYPCAYPSEVQCESNAIRQVAQPTNECPRQFGFFPVAGSDCSKYIMCQEGLGTVMNCPPGLVFNAEKDTCDWPENVPSCSPEVFRGFTCPAPPLEEDGTISDMIFKFRYNQSCKEYVACQRGHPRLLKCDTGLSFDEESGFCIDSEYVQNCKI